MLCNALRKFLVNLLSVAIVCTGFSQFAVAGKIDTGYAVDAAAREAVMDRVGVLLATEEVAAALTRNGVSPAVLEERLRGLSDEEILALQGQLDEQLAGGNILGIIGAVFVVLLILDLVGVTDIFKSI
jgi:hypothetical protein